jgi:putative oxidoreductase
MKKLFSTLQNQQAFNIWLLLFRICIAAFMLTHGITKLSHLFSGEEIKFVNFLGIGPTASFALSTFAEFLCSLFLLFGFATRLACIPLIINMAVAVLMAHANDPFKVKELALMYLIIFITFLVLGGGRYSVDHYLFKGNRGQ